MVELVQSINQTDIIYPDTKVTQAIAIAQICQNISFHSKTAVLFD